MTSGNPASDSTPPRVAAPGNTRRSRAVPLPDPQAAVLAEYAVALRHAPLTDSTKEKYISRLRGYLAWLADRAAGETLPGDPLTDSAAAAGAVLGFHRHLKDNNRASSTIDTYLSAIDDFYARSGLGRPGARRERDARPAPPRVLDTGPIRHYLRHVGVAASPRDRAIALLPYYAGLRISEVVGLDMADVRLQTGKGELRIRGKGRDHGKVRLVPVHPDLGGALADWSRTRAQWKGADTHDAVFLNHRGARLSDRAAREIITGLGAAAGLGDDHAGPLSPLVLRHTFAARLIRDGNDPILVAELLGHGSLDTTRRYVQSTEADREALLDALVTEL
ncbi:tyrosine-type recombinase/integrase [Spongiactinospora sp. TRM90649]|uniref:tyrosine-type recombinase/integrase n=1 Tax=Spongiactinospora sp. TRM90649 TaxID=3031114 RepID=UPI0023F97CE9|nr:tyrosine-type recombinase/integrase [Spongiactinospora sp. TRM90649]MDF5756242.1 tyrosine-type recombinase/integrase [Spongiactinospora sp. TRM90649]